MVTEVWPCLQGLSERQERQTFGGSLSVSLEQHAGEFKVLGSTG